MDLAQPTAIAEEGGATPSPSVLHQGRMAFRGWRHSRPFWAGLWTVLGGVLMLAGPITAFKIVFVADEVVAGIVVGAVVCILGLFLWFVPRERQLLGVFIVVGSIVSFFTSDIGGFVIGMLLGFIGGAMGFAWTPVGSELKTVGEQRAGEA